MTIYPDNMTCSSGAICGGTLYFPVLETTRSPAYIHTMMMMMIMIMIITLYNIIG